MFCVGHEKSVQDGGAGAGQTDDEERRGDRSARHLGMILPVPLEEKTIAQAVQCVRAQGEAAYQVEPRVAMAGFEQAGERFEEVTRPEIAQPDTLLRGGGESSGREGSATESHPAQAGGSAVEETNQPGWLA